MGTNKKTFGTRTNLSAFGTGLGSKIRINLDYINPSLHSFVADKVLQLVETPAIQPEIKFSALSDLPYVFEVFQNNSSCLAVINNLFTDNMIPICFETSLPTRNLAKKFLTGTGAFALEPCSQSLEFEPVSLDFSPTKELFTACYSNMIYSDINTSLKSVRNLADVNISGKCNVKEHPVMLVNSKQSSLITPVKILPIVFRNINRNINPAIDSCEPDLIKFKGKCSLVKGKGHNVLENWLGAFVSINRFKCLRSYTIGVYDELGREIKLSSCFVIAKVVKVISVVSFGFKAFVGYIGNSFGVLLHSAKKQFIHRNFKFDSCYGLHIQSNNFNLYKCFVFGGEKLRFLPPLKEWVSSQQF